MHELIARHRQAIVALCDEYGVLRLDLVGSAADGETFDPARSDLDFLVEFSDRPGLNALNQFFGFREALGRLTGRRVDLIEISAVRNPYLRAGFSRRRERLYAA